MAWIPGFRSVSDQAFLVSHETAHQWFYGIVGNDQSSDAFADEAMAEYLSRKATIGMRASRCKLDRLDKSIQGYRRGCYYETVYIQGALFLDSLRRDFGDKPFRRAIRRYATSHALGMGSDKSLLEAFRAEMGNKVLKRYRERFPSLY
jgi:aminopeptidase N